LDETPTNGKHNCACRYSADNDAAGKGEASTEVVSGHAYARHEDETDTEAHAETLSEEDLSFNLSSTRKWIRIRHGIYLVVLVLFGERKHE